MNGGGHNRWRKTLVATAGIGALVGVAWTGLGSEASSEATESSSARKRVALARAASRSSGELGGPCEFSSGARMAYDVTTRTHAQLDLSPLSDDVKVGGQLTAQMTAPQDQQVTRRWHLDLRAVGRAGDGSSVLAARVIDHGTQMQGEAGTVDEALATPFLVRVDARCGIAEFGWRTEGDRANARRQQALVSALSFWAPGRDGASTYGEQAFDALGHYRAIYRARPDGSIEGRIGGYSRPFAQPSSPLPPTLSVDHSSLAVEPGVGEWMTSLSSERAVGLAVGGETIGTMHSWVQAERAEPTDWRPQVEVSDGGWSWGLLLEEPVAESIDAPVDPTLAGMSPQDALATYLAMIHGGQTTAQYAGFLREWLRANPSGADTLVAMLQAGELDDEDRARSALFYALGTADTPEATAALVGLVDGDDTRLAHRVSAAHALSKLENPPAEVVDVLAAQAARTDIHPAARGSLAMAMGTFAHEADGRSPELAQQARTQIAGWLDAPSDVDELSGSLLAAGNAGHDDLAGAIAPYLDHEEPRIRQKAAHALRQMSPQEAFPRLEAGLDDAERSVRVKVLASATEVSRSHGVVPPRGMIETASEWLGDSNDRSEERALIALLGEAAKRGSDDARGALHRRYEQELASDQRDPGRLRALGAYAGGHWQAD